MNRQTLVPARAKRIGIIMLPEYRFGREIILGAAKYCMTHGVSLQHMGSQAPELLSNPSRYGVEGVVSYIASSTAVEMFKRWDVPLVSTSSRFEVSEVPSVQADNERIGRIGAEHFLSRGFRTLAFCGIEDHWYSKLRGDGFRAAAAEAGVQCDFNDQVDIDLASRPTESSLVKWLGTLSLPIGIMTCNDIRAKHLIEGCRIAKLRVPDDVAILGVDNDEVICQGIDPMLSSVDPNAYGIGFEAAAMLCRLIEKKKVEQRKLIPPFGVVPRQSTFTASAIDPTLAAALSLIHGKSESPLTVPDIAQRMGLSRRTLERRFRDHLGSGIADAIRRAHVERAKQLLIDTDLSLEEIAEASGLKDARQLRISFQRETGQSPTQIRQSFQKLN